MTEKIKNIKSLLASYHPKIKSIKKLKFQGIEGLDVYNISAPFKIKNLYYLLGRVELRSFELSLSVFFQFKKEIWKKCQHPIFNLQDPFHIKFDNQIIIGGVEVVNKSVEKGLSYRTVFYKGAELDKLKLFAKGPWGMKGVRFTLLPNHKLAVFTRPQGRKGRRGKIGFEILDSLNKITPRNLVNVKIIPHLIARGEWGGVNEIHLLKNGKLGILGHVARFSKNKIRFYYPMSFCFDYKTQEISGLKILLTRQDLPKGQSKREGLEHVVYPGGIVRKNGIAKLYVGVGDAESYEVTIEDPFKEYETIKQL